ncbi:MAG: T9SS type A sorting domain-containing protein [Saprospiraceae bacterium]|nr:T9SS type A sorting domain-containing protein [Saprospiraceae bacterium]
MRKQYPLTVLLLCFFAHVATAQSLLKDINTTTLSTYFGSGAAVLNGTAFFNANAGDGKGHELWKSDGSTGGTVLVKDIYPGGSGSSPSNFLVLTDKILFTAKDQEDMFGNDKIFTSDGTASGTTPLLVNNQPIAGTQLVQGNGVGYFTMTNPGMGTSLLRTDGSAPGTVIWSSTEPFATITEKAVIVENVAYYISLSSDYTYKLVRTDGTLQGTITLKTLPQPNSMVGLTAAGNTIYFWASTPDEGFALWKSDGSVAGTTLVVDLEPGQTGGIPIKSASTGEYLFFIKDSGAGPVCWRTDGTAAGTIAISQTIPYAATVFIAGSTVYVSAFALYASSFDGPLEPILNMNQGVQTIETNSMVALNGKLYFVALDATHGKEIWVSNGTESGTQLVRDINPGAEDSNAKPLFILNNQSYWTAFHPFWGSELWSTEGVGTIMNLRADINTNTNSSDLGGFETFGNVTLFPADNGTTGVGLWRHFPGENTISMVDSGPFLTVPSLFTRLGEKVVFQVADSLHGNELWSYDLQNHQAGLVADLNPGIIGSFPDNLTVCDGKVLFNAAMLSLNTVYATDGTPSGTVQIGDYPDINFYSPVCLHNDLLFSTGNTDLYKANYSSGEISLVKDFDSSFGLGFISYATEFNNRIFFSAPDAEHGQELWVSDGTPNGTVLFYDLFAGNNSSKPENLTVMNGLLYFTALNSNYGTDLWKTDGTFSGTVKIIEIIPPASPFVSSGFRSANTLLYFMTGISDGNYVSLWRSDGTSSGTFSFHQFGRSIYDTELFSFGNSVYYNGYDDLNGAELWKSDGTVTGTNLVSDICPGNCSSDPRNFAISDSLLYFTAYHYLYGREPWIMEAGTTSTSTSAGAAGLRMKILGNPAQSGSNIGIQLDVQNAATTVFHLFDITGRIVWQKEEFSLEGKNVYQFSIPVLSPGVYGLQATTGHYRTVGKVIITH